MSIFDAKTKTAVFVRSVGITSPFDILLYSPVVYYATMHAMVGVPLGWCLIVVMLNFFRLALKKVHLEVERDVCVTSKPPSFWVLLLLMLTYFLV